MGSKKAPFVVRKTLLIGRVKGEVHINRGGRSGGIQSVG